MARWPNIEKLAVAYLGAATGRRIVTKVPADLEQSVPLVRVLRGPGSDDEITDAPLLDVETFTASVSPTVDRWDLAEEIREAMHALKGVTVNGAYVDSVSTASGPTAIDYGNDAVDRLVASYRLNLRKRF